MKKKLLTKKYLLKEYLINKKTIKEIANKLNFSYTFIRTRLIKFNIPRRTKSEVMKGINKGRKRSDVSKRNKIKYKLGLYKGKNSPSYIDGRCLKKYYCKCGKRISINSALYGHGGCLKCYSKIRWKNRNHPMKGRKFTQAHRKKLSKARMGRFKGKNSPCFGKIAKHGKGAYYKNIYMRSTWEVKFAKFLDLSGINYLYESNAFDLGNSTYTPDFYIPEWDLWIEIKGWWRDDAKIKFELFKKIYTKERIKVLMQKDLEKLGIL